MQAFSAIASLGQAVTMVALAIPIFVPFPAQQRRSERQGNQGRLA
jgi:hypothetical protein